MRRIFIICIAMSLAFLSGCQRPYEMEYDFALNRDQLRFTKAESKAYFLVYSKSAWSVEFESEVEWATLSRTEGSGNGQVSVFCQANTSVSRGVNIIVTTSDGTSKKVYLSQEAGFSDGYYIIEDPGVQLLSKGVSVSLSAETNLPEDMFDDITIRIDPAEAEEWVKDVVASPTGISCVVSDYVGTESRQATIGVYFPAAEWDESRVTSFINVTQSNITPRIELSSEYILDPNGGTVTSIPLEFNWAAEYYTYDLSSHTFGDDSWIASSSYDAETQSLKVTPSRNKSGQPRETIVTCYVKDLEGTVLSQTSAVLTQDIFDGIEPADAVALYEGEKYANCYLIETAQAKIYSFDAKKPDGSLPADNMSYAEILWQNVTCPLDRVLYEDGKIYFRTVAGKNGNAVIVVKDADGVICWSWHIWVVGEALGTNTFNSTSAGVAPYVFMDRNLGATTRTGRTAAGLHYQYGRKDPFPSADPANYSSSSNQNRILVSPDNAITAEVYQNGVTIDWAIQHPGVYVWGSSAKGAEDWLSSQETGLWGDGTTKSIYDPCPYGWMVPAKNAYRNSDWWNNMHPTGSGVMTVGVGATCKDSNGNETNYPFSGRWRRTTADTHIAHAGTYCYLWTSTESSGLNEDYKGTWHIRVRDNNGSLSRGEETNQPRRWGANVRCVKIN